MKPTRGRPKVLPLLRPNCLDEIGRGSFGLSDGQGPHRRCSTILRENVGSWPKGIRGDRYASRKN
jgi:hypothetical protein